MEAHKENNMKTIDTEQDYARLVVVEWVDSHMPDCGWEEVDHYPEPKAKKSRSAGFMIKKNADAITIAGHIAYDPFQACGVMTIPHKAIISVRDAIAGDAITFMHGKQVQE